MDQLELKSLRGFGIHGALGLLMGIGTGFLALFIPGLISSLTMAYSMTIGVTFEFLVIYGIFGLYFGHIFYGQEGPSRTSKRFVAAGIIGGLVTSFLLAGEFIQMNSFFEPLFVTMIIAGPVLGFPKIKNMVIMTVLCSAGAGISYVVFVLGQNITVNLNSTWVQGGLFALFTGVLFSLIAIGIGGASMALGMYFSERTPYAARVIPLSLKIIGGAGIILTLTILLLTTLLFMGVAKYATTEVSIQISSGDGNTTIYVPVLLENGKIMEMHEQPLISGNAAVEIIDTDHGKALKIRGSGQIEVKMKQTGEWLAQNPEENERFVNGFTLSMSNSTGYGSINGQADTWIYSEKNNSKFSLSIIRDNGWGRMMQIRTQRQEELTAGWQIVRLSVGSMMYD